MLANVAAIGFSDCWIGIILSMIEGFLGHLPCRGQMSYWGITVMINVVAVLSHCRILALTIRL